MMSVGLKWALWSFLGSVVLSWPSLAIAIVLYRGIRLACWSISAAITCHVRIFPSRVSWLILDFRVGRYW